jgi:microcystin-dependent protein
MSEPFLSQIEAFAFGFAPKGWMPCNGQLLPIVQNQALFALLGTTYGGNGTTNFQLPDLRGRVAVGWGQSTTGTVWQQGEVDGVENVTVLESNMPPGPHTHAINVNPATTGNTPTPANNAVLASAYVQGGSSAGPAPIYSTAAPTVAMASLSPVGGQPHGNIAPVIAINYCICISGLFPSRG